MKKKNKVFDTDKRIRLGIWGLGRGMHTYGAFKFLNIDVVAGCDYNAHMRKNFLDINPGAFVTDNDEEFLKQDFDAVLLATFFLNHAQHAIRCLRAGKHVLSEVTSFFTMAEGVQLVEEVERSGLVYNQAENFPFSEANMYLARKWREGLFGDLMYAEYEYVHECRELSYIYIDGQPIQPGNTVHAWRSWLNSHYYCTHSLGPIMFITGARPTRVVALPSAQRVAGAIAPGRVGICPSLINMDNGAVVRNLMGGTTNDTHVQRLWGTLGAAEINVGKPLQLRLGGGGGSPKFEVIPKWDKLGDLAKSTGHEGGDFWTLFYFARQIFTGEQAPFDLYQACDVTIPGILAYRSSQEDGKPYAVPDFRNKAEREQYRRDDARQTAYDYKNGAFPANADLSLTGQFTTAMKDLIAQVKLYRQCMDWKKVQDDMLAPVNSLNLLGLLISNFKQVCAAYVLARKIADAYPQSDGARAIGEMLQLGEEPVVMARGFLAKLKRDMARDLRKYPRVLEARVSGLLPAGGRIEAARFPTGKIAWRKLDPVADRDGSCFDIRPIHEKRNGLVYVRCSIEVPAGLRSGTVEYRASGTGLAKVWLNRAEVFCESDPAELGEPRPRRCIPVTWRRGRNEFMFAINTNGGKAWGVVLCLPAVACGR